MRSRSANHHATAEEQLAPMDGMVAKAPLVLLGYLDSELGHVESASPTSAATTQSLMLTMGAHRGHP
eukprot:5279772-Prorocentrum_lima.AAC.1